MPSNFRRRRTTAVGVVLAALALRCTLVNDGPRLRAARAQPPLALQHSFSGLAAFPAHLVLEPDVPRCPEVGAGEAEAQGHAAAVDEASGLAVSAAHPGIVWTHNDSGDGPRLYALWLDGTLAAGFRLTDASAYDWEDMAVGPGPRPGQAYLYLGDIGDNQAIRPYITVYRVPEPDPLVAQEAGSGLIDEVATVHLAYPDRPHDAETLLVDPVRGDLYLVTKEKLEPSGVYRAAAEDLDQPLVPLARVGEIPFGSALLPTPSLATGGDVARDGQWVVVRTYTQAFAWWRPPGEPLHLAFEGPPCPLPVPAELQGEAIALTPSSDGYLSLGEGAETNLWRFDVLGMDPEIR